MMNFKSPVEALRQAASEVGGLSELGVACGIPRIKARATVWAWTDRGMVPIEYCAGVDKASKTVRRWHLRPDDWHRIWPELVGIDGAPPVPQSEAA